MRESYHGGQCCGIIHIHSLRPSPDEASISTLDRMTKNICLGNSRRRKVKCKLVEVVINNSQYKQGWGKVLEDIGYKEVSSFINVNSGSKVRIYHYYIPT